MGVQGERKGSGDSGQWSEWEYREKERAVAIMVIIMVDDIALRRTERIWKLVTNESKKVWKLPDRPTNTC